jgi:hypothetical protein
MAGVAVCDALEAEEVVTGGITYARAQARTGEV